MKTVSPHCFESENSHRACISSKIDGFFEHGSEAYALVRWRAARRKRRQDWAKDRLPRNGERLLKTLIRWAVYYGIGLCALGLLLTFSWPFFMYLYTSSTGRLMDMELSARWSAFAAVLLPSLVLFLVSLYLGRKDLRNLSLVLLASLLVFLPILFLDKTSLILEPSWIRYPTAAFLFLAGVCMYFISRRYNSGEKWPKPKEYIWLVLGSGLIFAALDELAEIHERVGYLIERTLHLPHYFGDLVTLGYAFVGIAAITLFFWLKQKGKIFISPTFGYLYLLGIAVFGTAQFFDTFDIVFQKVWMMFGVWLSGVAPGLVSAFFTFWYDPRLTLNSIEEIYECTAALLFCLGTLSLVWKREYAQAAVSSTTKRTVFTFSTLLLFILVLLPWCIPGVMYSKSPFFGNTSGEFLAGAWQGLYHADGLSYDKNIGLIVANESEPKRLNNADGPGLLVYKNNSLERLPDPTQKLRDSDSVTSFNGAIYVSDGATDSIYRYESEKKEFILFANIGNGVLAPESMAFKDGDMYFVNEKLKAIFHIDKSITAKPETPVHEKWVTPEDIIFVPALSSFLVSDDSSGTIFKYVPGKPLEVWAQDGLRDPESLALLGSDKLVATDNGTGELLTLDLNGKVLSRRLLKFSFRDAQGVATDELQNIYFITADGTGSVSPVPSILWKY